MKIFFDTEFSEIGGNIHLISLGAVDEKGREFYAINEAVESMPLSPWLKTNVVEKLQLTGRHDRTPLQSLEKIAGSFQHFVEYSKNASSTELEFWAYYGAYDWVILCHLFGGMLKMPYGWPQYFHDLRVYLNSHGLRHISDDDKRFDIHNALADARWVKYAHGLVVS